MRASPLRLLLCWTLAVSRSSGFAPPAAARRRCVRTLLPAIPEPLETEGAWSAYLDEENTGLIYYFNSQTGESLWEPPTSTFPSVSLSRRLRRKAEAKQEEYNKASEGFEDNPVEEQAVVAVEEPEEKKGWFQLRNKEPESTTVVVEDEPPVEAASPPATEEPSWFDTLFKATQAPVEEEEVVVEEEAASPGIFGMFQPTKKAPEEIVYDEPAPIKITMGYYVLPHPAKITWGGEDAVFTRGRTFGVFDGVSQATKLDGVPLYSKSMARELRRVVGDEGLNTQQMVSIMTEVSDMVVKTSTGATTAILASISDDGFLRLLNVGDSKCIVIRNGAISGRSKDRNHYFDCPYQLSAQSPDRPREGTKLNMELVRGDLILMGSDGVFDNLSEDDILDLVSKSSNTKPTFLARKIVDASRKVSLNPKATTPYAKEAQKRGDPDYSAGLGGKVDDVSCIAVRYE